MTLALCATHHQTRMPSNQLGGVTGSAAKVCRLLCLVAASLGGLQMAVAQSVPAAPVVLVSSVTPASGRQWLSPPPGDAVRGAVLYQSQCTVCHSVDANKIGPAHRGVLGRRIGSLPGYSYSSELAASRLRWTPQTLFTWLGEPEDLVAGQRMGFAVEDAQQRGDLIAYLATLK